MVNLIGTMNTLSVNRLIQWLVFPFSAFFFSFWDSCGACDCDYYFGLVNDGFLQSEESGIYRHYLASTAERDGIASQIIATLLLQTCIISHQVSTVTNCH